MNASAAQPGNPSMPLRAASVATPLRVLVVDDSAPVRMMIKHKLEDIAGASMPLTVDLACDGWQALALVQDTVYDIVFLDVNMPDMDGFEACRRIKQIRPGRVVMLSAMTSHTDHAEGHKAGCDNYLTKPPHDGDIKALLRLVSLKKLTAG